jgi:hypothetical protein
MVGVPQELVQEKYNAQAGQKKKKEDAPAGAAQSDKMPIIAPIIAPPINANFQGAMNPPVYYANPIPSIPEELKAGSSRIAIAKPTAPVIPVIPVIPPPLLVQPLPQKVPDPIIPKTEINPIAPDGNDLIYSEPISIVNYFG